MESDEVRFQFGPPVRPIFLAGVRYPQAGILLVSFTGAVLFIRLLEGQYGLGAALLVVAGGVTAAFASIGGRPVDDWLPVIVRWLVTLASGRRRWTSPTPTLGERAEITPTPPPDLVVGTDEGDSHDPPPGAKRVRWPQNHWPRRVKEQPETTNGGPVHKGRKTDGGNKRRGQGATKSADEVTVQVRKTGKPSPPPPVRDWQLIYTSVSGTKMGVLRDRRHKSWVAVVGVQGRSFMLLDEAEKIRRMSSWAAVQASMARHGSPVARIQWLERSLTEVGDEMRGWFEERGTDKTDSGAHQSYAQLLAAAQPVTQQHQNFVVLQVTATKAARAIKQAGGGDRGAVTVLYRELVHLQRQLRESDLSVRGFLTGDELAGLVRTQFDPEGVLAMAARQADSDSVPTSARNAWPLATEVSWGHYRTDNTYHITYWVAEWPKLGVRPSFLAPLLLTSSSVARTISVVAEPVPIAEAFRKVEHEQTARLSDDELRSSAGYRTGARRQREAEAINRRENELADGHAEYRYSGYVTVSGTELDEVEAAAATLEQAAYQCPIELRRLWGEQEHAFYTTLPLAKGLS